MRSRLRQRRGALVMSGHCSDMHEVQPYLPFVEVLEGAVRIIRPEALLAALGDAAPEAARLMPELRRLFAGIPPHIELPLEQERRYLLNSLSSFFARAAQAQPVLLVLDDLHWADAGSLLLVEHIAKRLAELPMLVLGTYRDVELTTAHPFACTLRDLLRAHAAHDIRLRRLPAPAVAAMIAARGMGDPPVQLVQIIHSETEGNPFFVQE